MIKFSRKLRFALPFAAYMLVLMFGAQVVFSAFLGESCYLHRECTEFEEIIALGLTLVLLATIAGVFILGVCGKLPGFARKRRGSVSAP